ncbi:ADP-ribosylglycohydrolase family protein [Succinatimonas hippei]|uniref:ADP-ribosylglycohydrolase n=1 Tax=Succinatimonas hippei (strain DSM 22608 / JCM 16073 / KCTC 15190 / YIT 12066) TaxID=762983 RepID=E8LHH5_SUCHY|nr:ADP-ribosylglycohydrolase family protein [Succinatimonas hippei]EFY07994.1 ADP-ribosylglycohydrolase [Succinatimonas hippei YIT 12066]
MSLKDKIAGTLAGMVYGDAFGVPGELWPREKVRSRFGTIDKFLDGPEDNIVACYFKAGHYTDDSSQALVILNDLLKYGHVPEAAILAKDLIAWVESMNGFEINLLGPSSKASLLAHVKGEDYTKYTKTALTNGAAMRIAPVGTFFNFDETKSLCRTVAKVSSVTHGTDVAIAGASMVAQAVASGLCGRSYDEMLEDICKAFDFAVTLGEPTWAASIKDRLLNVLDKAKGCTDPDKFSLLVYNLVGTGTMTSESVTAALAIAYYCQDVEKAAFLCANMGGDTDTIGSMACAICGAFNGLSSIKNETISYLEKTNDINFADLADKIIKARASFIKE